MAKKTKAQLQTDLDEFKNKVKSLETEREAQNKEWETKLKLQGEENQKNINEQNARIRGLESQVKEKENQLNQKELKKLAQAYADQESEYKISSRWWAGFVILSVAVLAYSTSWSAVHAAGKIWYEKIEYYLVNFVVITFLVFSLKTFSYFVRLRTDFANRKTLAQSYHNILSSNEDEPIRQKFIDKVTDILCAQSNVHHESYTIPEKLLDTLGEIAKNLSKQ